MENMDNELSNANAEELRELIIRIRQITSFADWRKSLIEELQSCCKELENHVFRDKVANTTGNGFSIAGAFATIGAIAFPPAAPILVPVAVGCLASGLGTSAGATIHQNVKIANLATKFNEKLQEDAEKLSSFTAAFSFIEQNEEKLIPLISSLFETVTTEFAERKSSSGIPSSTLEKFSTLSFSNLVIKATLRSSMLKLPSLTSLALKSAKGSSSLIFKILGRSVVKAVGEVVTVGISVSDIVNDWTTNPAALTEMKTAITLLEENLKELQDFCRTSQFSDFCRILDELIEIDKESTGKIDTITKIIEDIITRIRLRIIPLPPRRRSSEELQEHCVYRALLYAE